MKWYTIMREMSSAFQGVKFAPVTFLTKTQQLQLGSLDYKYILGN